MTHCIARPLALALALTLTATAPLAGAERAPRPGSIQAVRATAESALTVTGTIDVDAAGKVLAFTLDQPEKLPPGVVTMAGDNIPAWTFEPMVLPEGKTASRMRMSMLFVASKRGDGTLTVALRHPTFSTLDGPPTFRVVRSGGTFSYPPRALQAGVTGAVYMVVRFDRTGTITDAMVEQVNLGVVDSEAGMAKWRRILAEAALRDIVKVRVEAADTWVADGQQTQIGRIPLMYTFDDAPGMQYGQWVTYVPGPRTEIPWSDAAPLKATAPDALAPNELQLSDAGVRRLIGPPAG